jgi:Plasmid encoded RepA protein
MSRGKGGGLVPIGQIPLLKNIAERYRPPTPIQKRIVEAAALFGDDPDAREILYQHSAFCQVFFPYRDPGDQVLTWDRSNGIVDLRLKAGEAKHPNGEWVQIPLPFGPKCRLVLMYINQVALRTQSPHIELEDSLTAFVSRILNLDPKGRNIRMVKEQLRRLAASSIRLGSSEAGTNRADTTKVEIVKGFDLWFPKDEHQRVLWPTYVDLSLDYFDSLLNRAVPLPEHHIAALSHSGLALDIYAWLAQRLHRIPPNKPAFVSWAALHGQFGQGYEGRIRKFRENFRSALKQVLALYKEARITDDPPRKPSLFIEDGARVWKQPPAEGLTLRHSPPPVARRLISI